MELLIWQISDRSYDRRGSITGADRVPHLNTGMFRTLTAYIESLDPAVHWQWLVSGYGSSHQPTSQTDTADRSIQIYAKSTKSHPGGEMTGKLFSGGGLA